MKLFLVLLIVAAIVSTASLAGAHAVGLHGEITALVCGFIGSFFGFIFAGAVNQ